MAIRRAAGGAALLLACSDPTPGPDASADAVPPWGAPSPEPAPRPGMVWIPAGTLVAGTPKDRVPRVPDAEMAGEAIEMTGFFIDRYPHPNEAGAIPTTHVTWEEAKALCQREDKRLCTELELERACKGPTNQAYAYGPTFRQGVCGEGGRGVANPSGLFANCRSGFGVHDTHGTVWVWTASEWGRETVGLVALRGGSGDSGELVARCAHGESEKPAAKRPDLGLRCCAGPANLARVTLDVDRGPALKLRPNDEELIKRLELLGKALPSLDEGTAMPGGSPNEAAQAFDAERAWMWRPAGNEQLFLGGGCSKTKAEKTCGVVVARDTAEGTLAPLAFVATDEWQPTLSESERAESVFIHGGDRNGAFRKRVTYEWGRIGIGEKQRKKRRKKGKPRYE
ncbi:MAG: formylglycine-generating enzyme family protein [Polyangiaceae bacterium]|nr:formylglycine-generating enzyme family protein [Polyangiaceae bacterium]